MSNQDLFVQAFIYLAAAVIAVPLAKRFGLGSVLGYLLAGIVIGPFGIGLVGAEGEDVLHFAEFGVVLLLFIIGLELEPALLWRSTPAPPAPRRTPQRGMRDRCNVQRRI
jgi:Kef-type K+ transport system membrane component KefB